MIVCTLKDVLKKKKWTRYELQKRSKVTYTTLHALFHGRNKLYSADVLNKLCYALECQPADLLKWKPDRFPRKRMKAS